MPTVSILAWHLNRNLSLMRLIATGSWLSRHSH
jgi:hypothetical protein